MLGLLLLTCLAVRGQSTNSVGTNEFVRVDMTVLNIAQLSTYKGPLIPRDPEPRFALTLRVDSSVPPIPNLKAGTILTFAVHSPTISDRSIEKGESFFCRMSRKAAISLAPQGHANQQGGVNERQPSGPETNRASGSAASGRSTLIIR